jgi:hypothetical protein
MGATSSCSSSSGPLAVESGVELPADLLAMKDRLESSGLTCESEIVYGTMFGDVREDDIELNCQGDEGGKFTRVTYFINPYTNDPSWSERVRESLWCTDYGKDRSFDSSARFVSFWSNSISKAERDRFTGSENLSWWVFCGQKAVDTYKTAEPLVDVDTKNACNAMESAYESWLASGERVGTVKGDAKYETVLSKFTTALAPSGPLKTRVGDQSITDAWAYLEGSGTAFEPVHVYAGALNFVNHLTAVRAQLEKSRNSWRPDFVEESYLREIKRPCGKFK